MNKNVVLFLMAGNGTRYGEAVPKQFTKFGANSIPIFIPILKQLNKVSVIDEIIVITHPDYYDYTIEEIEKNNVKNISKVLTGGEGRSKDILHALKEIKDNTKDSDNVLMYDATHPFVDVEGFKKVVEVINEKGAATLGQFQYDTTYFMNEETHIIENVIPRRNTVSGASPEGFKFGDIYKIYIETEEDELNDLTSAGAIAIVNSIKMYVVETKIPNVKITYKNDMEIVKQLSDYYFEEGELV